MSDLNSDFNVDYGWPYGSAMEHSFPPEAGVELEAGIIVTLNTDQLLSAAALKMVDDSLITAPTLTASDAGNAYEIATAGGVWNAFTAGDIVEWDGTAWNLLVAQSGGDPPDGTRVVVTDASAAGSFAGQEEEVWVITSGTWAAATAAPADGAKIDISAASSIYAQSRFQYVGTHPAGAWALFSVTGLVSAFISKMTSVAVAGVEQSAWIVNEGNKANIETDGTFTDNLACLKIASGVVFKVKTVVANTLAPDDYVEAAAGLIVKCDGTNHAIGQVQYSNGVTGAGGVVIVTGI